MSTRTMPREAYQGQSAALFERRPDLITLDALSTYLRGSLLESV